MKAWVFMFIFVTASVSAAKTPNYYLQESKETPTATPAPRKTSAAPTKTALPARAPAPSAARPLPLSNAATPRATVPVSRATPAKTRAAARVAATQPAATAASPPRNPTRAASPTKSGKASPSSAPSSAAARATEPAASSASRPAKPTSPSDAAPLRFKYDAYDLALVFTKRWDMLNFVVTAREAYAYRVRSGLRKVERFGIALQKLGDSLNRRQRNLYNGALATYAIASAGSDPFYLGENLTLPHLVAVRSTLRHDLDEYLLLQNQYDPLQRELDDTVRLVALLANSAPDTMPPPGSNAKETYPVATPYTITRPLTELIAAQNDALIRERSVSPASFDALQLIDFLVENKRRPTLTSFAPPAPEASPEYDPFIPLDTPLPIEKDAKPRPAPPFPQLERPAEDGYLVHAGYGATIHAAAEGTVAYARPLRGYNQVVILQHANGLLSLYGYLETTLVHEGDKVPKGHALGKAGRMPGIANQTGIRFEVRKGTTITPIRTLTGSDSLTAVVNP